MLVVDNINVYYGSSHILQGLSFAHGGGILGILGRNGAGKTTLAKAIMGLVAVKSGTIRIFDQETTNQQPYAIARRGIGYVPQGRQIFTSLTVHEHLEMLQRRNEPGWTADRVYELFPRLAERRSSPGDHLSGGEQQMLAIGRALLINPKLLIMDEPSEGLAPVVIETLAAKFRSLAAIGMSLLLIEQNLQLTAALAEEILLVDQGRVERQVKANTLMKDRELQENFLGVRLRT